MQARRLSVQHIIVIVLLVVHILPVWLFKYTCTQDGPAHVHNVHVLKGPSQSRKLHTEGSLRTQSNAFPELDFPRIDGGAYVYLSAPHLRKNIL